MKVDWNSAPVLAARASVSTDGDVKRALEAATVPGAVPDALSPGVAPGQWGRFVGMVQDVWDAELFVAASKQGDSGLLVESNPSAPMGDVQLSERLPVYLVSLPGATAWTRPRAPASSPTGGLNRKRLREADPTPAFTPAPASSSSSRPPLFPNKPFVPAGAPPAGPAGDGVDKRQRPGPSVVTPEQPFLGLGMNLPNAGEGGSAVLAKIYGNYAELNLKVNSLVEVFGIVQPPLKTAGATEGDASAHDVAFAEECAARNPQMVPRLHAVRVRVLPAWEVNPALAPAIHSRGIDSCRADLAPVLPEMRAALVRFLAAALDGDALAAEYVLMALVSRPVLRTSAGATLGKLSLNVILPKAEESGQTGARDAAKVSKALKMLLPSVVGVSINIAALNARDFYPRKDYVANRLRAAPLQLPPGSCLLGDETGLCDGRLAERGVKNVRALESVASRCIVPADFQFYDADLPTENCSLFLSRGGKSIVKTDIQLRVVPREHSDLPALEAYSPDQLGKLRLALGLLVEDGTFDISKEVSTAIEQHFVNVRRDGKAKDGQEVLSRWLAVARAGARTFGEAKLSMQRWQYIMQLEGRREEEMAKMKSSA